ncbi:hypothetical protein DL769_009996 [Monosporascus sp. CRB-8-3]|nr:hypothetical protein DL769_009996 [Monosporascus sp. CRB-8-3]
MANREEKQANQAYQKQYQRQTLQFRYYRDKADRIDLDSINHEDEIPDDNVVARAAWRLLEGGKDKNIQDEIRAMKKLTRAYHSVQMIDPPSVGRPAQVLPQTELPSDDSSVPAQSSADEAEYKEPPERRRRKDMTRYDRAAKLNAHRVRQRTRKLAIEAQETRLKAQAQARERKRSLRTRGKAKEPAPPDDEDADADAGDDDHDYILLEYMKNGDMANMLYRLNEQDERVPNRVLWSFFLCLIRGCIGMAWYPRRFHPQRGNNPDRDLIEQIPAGGSVQERCMKRMVHFDIDLKNSMFCFRSSPRWVLIFIQVLIGSADGPSDDPGSEHRVVPRIKEQFTQDWDTLPLNRDGSNVCDEPIAGNYGPPTNIWHVGLMPPATASSAEEDPTRRARYNNIRRAS